jgi:hypothetical protein
MRHVLRIPFEPLAKDPLVDIYGGTPWEPWPPQLAAERFLAELQFLIRQSTGLHVPSRLVP